MVDIIEYFQGDFPEYVLCQFYDVFGKKHYFNEKIPIVSSENINNTTILPKKGFIAGEFINKGDDLINFSSIKPYDIETIDGINTFCVKDYQIINEVELKIFNKINCIIDDIWNDILLKIEECRKIIIEYKSTGGKKEKIINYFMELIKLYDENKMEKECNFIGDILDILTGYYVGKNIEW